MKTWLFIAAVLACVVGWEFYALSNPSDDVFTFTHVFREMPCWGKVIAYSLLTALSVHFYWRDNSERRRNEKLP